MNQEYIFEKISQLRLPQEVSAADLIVAARDAEIIGDRIRSQPEKMQHLANAILKGEREVFDSLLTEVRLTESDVVKDGGGLIWLVVVVVLLYSTDAY